MKTFIYTLQHSHIFYTVVLKHQITMNFRCGGFFFQHIRHNLKFSKEKISTTSNALYIFLYDLLKVQEIDKKYVLKCKNLNSVIFDQTKNVAVELNVSWSSVKKRSTPFELLSYVSQDDLFPNVAVLLIFYLLIVRVSFACFEKCCFKLKVIKNNIQSSIYEQRVILLVL